MQSVSLSSTPYAAELQQELKKADDDKRKAMADAAGPGMPQGYRI
ncbi:hypothetical protein [Bradyrhizobium forestalis]|nr:hypothetical protein [Bradyrhizobium forestalis]